MSGKRAFPYYSEVQGFELQRRRLEEDPSREKDAPKIWQAREHSTLDDYDAVTGDAYAAAAAAVGTDFRQWSEAEVRAFLDQRGEDYDDCPDFDALCKRAAECEANTGPAQRPTVAAAEGRGPAGGGDDEVDPLDAFMAEIGQMETTAPAKPRSERVEEEDHVTDFVKARRRGQLNAVFVAGAAAGRAAGGDEEDVYKMAAAVDAATGAAAGGDYDSDDELAGKRKDVEALAALEHDGIAYSEFNKDFYEEAPAVAAMTPAQVNEYRRQLGMRVSGFDPPKPVKLFSQCGFDAPLTAAIAKAGYQQPTAIQAQALPAALSGRDVLGIAKTGSGKTAAFVLPMIVHLMDQPELQKGEGPIGVVVAPTRELAEQIHKETRRFSKPYGLGVCAAFGGLSKHQQFKDLKAGCEVAVCTPGRMIDLIKMKACTMKRVTYLVFDEADRMFDMGFEPQVRSIMGQIRPDRQTLLFSATMPRRVERLAADALTSPIRITVGEVGAANEDIKQVVEVVYDVAHKQKWLLDRLQGFIDEGDVLVFANQKARVDELCAALQAAGARVASIHGDMDQHTRMTTLNDFKAGQFHALVATDVAARGLDIKSIKTVVNYDAAKDIDTHVHRISRHSRWSLRRPPTAWRRPGPSSRRPGAPPRGRATPSRTTAASCLQAHARAMSAPSPKSCCPRTSGQQPRCLRRRCPSPSSRSTSRGSSQGLGAAAAAFTQRRRNNRPLCSLQQRNRRLSKRGRLPLGWLHRVRAARWRLHLNHPLPRHSSSLPLCRLLPRSRQLSRQGP